MLHVPLFASAPSFLPAVLAQAAPEGQTKSIWQVLLENSLALTITFIFLTAIIGVLVKTRRKDKCLKLLRHYHVTLLTKVGKSLWGDLKVYPTGVELLFDAPHTTRRGLIKTSALLYAKQMENCLAICRFAEDLTDKEKRKRLRQIRKTFRPNIFRRFMRWVRNLINTLQDAFSKSLNLIIGAIAKSRPNESVVTSQQGEVTSIGDTLLGAAGNAYEPMLEAHIGKSVVVEIASDADATKAPFEMQGYLVDYSQHYLAVFSVDHQLGEDFAVDTDADMSRANLGIKFESNHAKVTCTGPDAIFVRSVTVDGNEADLGTTLLPGTTLSLRRGKDGCIALNCSTTKTIDVVCPRAYSQVFFGSRMKLGRTTRQNWLGVAPDRESETSGPATTDKGQSPATDSLPTDAVGANPENAQAEPA